jgi:cytochrome c553
MKLRVCGLAFILVGFLNGAGAAETAIERGSYLVNTIGACGNCHARDTAFNRDPGLSWRGYRGPRSWACRHIQYHARP